MPAEIPYTDVFGGYRQSFHLGREAVAALGRTPVACLATADRDGQPHATTVWFAIADGGLVVGAHHSAYKVRNIKENPRVHLVTRYVRAFGTARIDRSKEAVEACRILLRSRYGAEEQEGVAAFLPVIDCVIDVSIGKVSHA